MILPFEYLKNKVYIRDLKKSLPFEYFKNKVHITDLKKIKENELYKFIRLFQNELKDFNKSEDYHLEELKKAFIELRYLFKDIRFILNGYIYVIEENDLTQCGINEIDYILTCLDEIEYYFIKIKYFRKNKKKFNELMDECILKIRGLYVTLSEFIFNENYLWEELN